MTRFGNQKTFSALQFLLFVAVGTVVALPSLRYPWHADDLHLVRTFSTEQLQQVWHSNWDIDGIESVGYRPLTVLFNHGRTRLFGEAVAAHRMFLIAMFAGYLVLIGLVARRFGMTRSAMTLAGVVMLCAKYSSYHFVWISDGVHLAQGVLFTFAALAILRWVESRASGWLVASVLAFLASVLVREDSLAVLPVLIALAVAHTRWSDQWPTRRNRLCGYAAILASISVAVLFARQAMFPQAAEPSWTTPIDLMAHLGEVVTLAGWHPRLWMVVFVAIFVWLLVIVRRLPPPDTRVAWMWLAFAAVSCSPGIVETRVNLLFFPMTFYSLFVGHVVVALATGRATVSNPAARITAAVLTLVCIAIPLRESRLQQLSMAPGSLDHLAIDCEVARGGEWSTLALPERRLQSSEALRRFRLSVENCHALLAPSRSADGDAGLPNGVFAPPRGFLTR